MTQAATTGTKAKTTTHAAFPFGLQDMPKFDPPQMEVPAALREFAEKGVTLAKENYGKIEVATEEMTVVLERTYATATKGVADYNLKLFEMARANSDAAFEFACGLIVMKSLREMLELSTRQARKHFDLISTQNKELWALAEKMATETAEPIKQSVTKAFNKVA